MELSVRYTATLLMTGASLMITRRPRLFPATARTPVNASRPGKRVAAWLVAGFGLKVDIAAYAMPMLVFGVILQFKKDNKVFAGIASILIGLGFLFLGIAYMKEGFDTFSNQINLAEFAIPGIKGLIVYTLIGMLATVVMQSSHATLILTITALAAGQVSYENALALAIGSNIGTTITAILGALGANIAGKRLAGAHLIFNAVTGLLALIFIRQFMAAVNAVANSSFSIAPCQSSSALS